MKLSIKLPPKPKIKLPKIPSIKLRKRHIYLLIAVLSAAVFLWVAYGHLYRLRVDTKAFCELTQEICFLNAKTRVDILDEHRAEILNLILIPLGLSLIAFTIAFFNDFKRKLRASQSPAKNKAKSTT